MLLSTCITCEDGHKKQRGRKKATPIYVITPTKQTVATKLPFVTFVTPSKEKTLVFGVDGIIQSCTTQLAKKVKPGEILCQLSTVLIDGQLRALTSKLNAAIDLANPEKIRRHRTLFQQNMISKTQAETAEAKFQEAQALLAGIQSTVQTLQKKRELHQIKSPFAGIIAKNFSPTLTTVKAGMPAFHLIARDTLAAAITVHLSYRPQITPRTKIRLFPPAAQPILPSLEEISGLVDPISQEFKVHIAFNAPDILPGQMIEGEIIFDSRANITLIPINTLVRRYSKSEGEIFTIVDKKLVLQKIVLGQELENLIEVTSSLLMTTKIASSNISQLSEGQFIREISTDND